VAAFFNKRSASFEILKMAKEGRVQVLWTEPIKREAQKILTNIQHALRAVSKKRFSFKGKKFLSQVFREENKIINPPKLDIIKEDPDDNKFLSCALKGKADLIITNDNHLLKIKNFKQIPILTPIRALEKLKLLHPDLFD
jgi:putative PIN family toxin of toxin-antitoxin system